MTNINNYSDEQITHLEGLEAVRRRPGMYIGKLGDGSQPDDGIYILLKETIDNSIDEFRMKAGNKIDIILNGNTLSVRDYGRGIPQGKLVDTISQLHTGAKFDSNAFQKSVGLNGVGIKAVNALSANFIVRSFRDGKVKEAMFQKGNLISQSTLMPTSEPDGTYVEFTPDNDENIFGEFNFNPEFIETMLKNYTYLNTGLTLNFNSKSFFSQNGLADLLNENLTEAPLYPIAHFKGEDIEIAFSHSGQYGEEYYSFVNGQHTTSGGTHQSAFKEAFAKTIRDFYNKNMEFGDIRMGLTAAISVGVQEPVFESQTKIKLGSTKISKDGITILKFVSDYVGKEVDNYLHKNSQTADILLKKIQESEKERKAIVSVTKNSRQKLQKISLHNKKLRDCRFHYNDALKPLSDNATEVQRLAQKEAEKRNESSSIFITEGNSAAGSITKTRNPNSQAVFALRGKSLNTFGKTKQIVYQNEELNLLQAALNIEYGLEGLRYNKIIIATDADMDGMHIRLLLMTFFLQFFPEMVKKGHVYILQTPLFRVRNKKTTIYCYSEEERVAAIKKLGATPEITRFKGLGEIDPDEFKAFIGKDMRLDKVTLRKEDTLKDMLEFYMGQNTPTRQEFIIENLNPEVE
jgi:topoisomerase-4 subunit B